MVIAFTLVVLADQCSHGQSFVYLWTELLIYDAGYRTILYGNSSVQV